MAVTKNVNQYNAHIQGKSDNNQSTYLCENERKPAKRAIAVPASAEYDAAPGKRHVVPPSAHATAEVVFDNGGKEPKIGNFPTNMSRFMKGRDFDMLIDQINAPSTSSTKLSSSTVAKPEKNRETISTKAPNSNTIDKWRQEEVKQIKALTVRIFVFRHNLQQQQRLSNSCNLKSISQKKVGKSPSWEERNGIYTAIDDD